MTFPLQQPEGRVGIITGRVGPGTIGEILVPFKGGKEAFYAYPVEHDEVIEQGELALVVQYKPPRSVFVTKWEGGEVE